MDTRSIRRGSRAAALILLAGSAQAGLKHDFDRAVFVYAYHPDVPLSRFAAGETGIPEPQHARIYLFAAYRFFEGRPLSAHEQQLWLRVWEARARATWPVPPLIPGSWNRVRKQVPIPVTPAKPGRRSVPLRDYMYFDLCSSEAYETAARTLAERIRRFGAASNEVKFWTAGQDAVLRACETSTPETLAAPFEGLHPLLAADRQYQSAAMLFYAQHFEEAGDQFRRIAQDTTSPWRVWAPYMVGRTLLWQARQTQSEALYKQKLREAEAQFRAVLADRGQRPAHTAAEYLLLRCMLATDAPRALERIGARLNRGTWRETDLTLYLNGMDSADVRPSDAVSEWVGTFSKENTYSQSLSRWKQTRSRAWLYAALWRAPADAPDELIRAALAVPFADAGGPAIRYGAARLLASKGRFDEARAQIDEGISHLTTLPSAGNRAEQLRAQLSKDIDEFIRCAPRKVICGSTEMDAGEWPEEITGRPPVPEAAKLTALSRFDETTAAVFNERVPLRTLRLMAVNEALPPHLRHELQVVAWTKAVLLERFDIARGLGPALLRNMPALRGPMQQFLQSSSQTTAAFVLLNLPGARPYVSRGYGRNLPVTEHDEWGRNWWYRFRENEMHGIDLPYVGDVTRLPPALPLIARLPFLTPEEESEAAQENAALRKTGERGLNWIALRVAAAIEREPTRPNAAESLFRLLDASRLINWAHRPDIELPQPGLKAAYRLLSTRYRGTRWFRALELNEPGFDFPRLE